jgi:hypothetical protein
VPSASEQLVANQIVGVAVNVNPPQIGASAGAIDVVVNLSVTNLSEPGANLPLSNSAQPAGDVPVNSPATVAAIADPNQGIASTAMQSARAAILGGLQSIGYAPDTANDPMTNFSNGAGCAFAAEPLLVPSGAM